MAVKVSSSFGLRCYTIGTLMLSYLDFWFILCYSDVVHKLAI